MGFIHSDTGEISVETRMESFILQDESDTAIDGMNLLELEYNKLKSLKKCIAIVEKEIKKNM